MPTKVAVLMGSASDRETMQPAADTLERFGLEADVRVLSAHRNPHAVAEFASGARANGFVAVIRGHRRRAERGVARRRDAGDQRRRTRIRARRVPGGAGPALTGRQVVRLRFSSKAGRSTRNSSSESENLSSPNSLFQAAAGS
jgi:hypothetical protein